MEKEKKNKNGKVIVLVIILLLIIGGLGCYYFFGDKIIKNNKTSNSTTEVKAKEYVFAYLDGDNNIKILDKDNKLASLKVDNFNFGMSNGLKYDDNKLYYLDRDGYFHSIDLKDTDLKDTKLDIKVNLGDVTSSGVKTFFVKDGFIAYVDEANGKAVKVDLSNGEETVITNELIKKATFTYYNMNNDSVYLDMNKNLYDPYKINVINNKGLVEEITYTLDTDSMNEDYFTVYNNDKGTCVYNAKTKNISNCVKTKETSVTDNISFDTMLYKDTIVYLYNDKIYMLNNGNEDELFTIDESIENKDSLLLFYDKDGVILAAGKTISCHEGCSYDYKYYLIKDGSANEIEGLSGEDVRSSLNYVVID